MKNNLNMIKDTIEAADNDANKSLFFYNNPDARVRFIMDIIRFSAHAVDNMQNEVDIQIRSQQIIEYLDRNYHQYAWPAHEIHFHTSFMQHASCPFTCLNEISTIVEKMMKEKFAA